MKPSDIPAARALEAAADALRAEGLALPSESFVPMPSKEQYTGAWRGFLLGAGKWEHEFPGVDFVANRARCPVAAALIQDIPGAVVAGYLRMEPGARLGPHADEREDDVIRVHIALQLPPEEQAYWPEGTARLLDVRVLHEAANPSDRPRLTFVVDVRVPAPIATGDIAPWGPPPALASP